MGSLKTLDDFIKELEENPPSKLQEFKWKLRRGWKNTKYFRYRVLWAYQRARYGHDDSAYWNIDTWLCEQLGAVMLDLANNYHGWPSGEEFPTPESWEKALRYNAHKITAWAHHYDISDPQREQKVYADAQKAFHWVADHLANLWD